MIASIVRALVAFFLGSYLGMMAFSKYQNADEIPLASKTAVLLGLILASNSVHTPPLPRGLEDRRLVPPYLQFVFGFVLNTVFVMFIVFTKEPAYAIIPIAMAAHNAASYAPFTSGHRVSCISTIILTIAALFYYDQSGPSQEIADAFRDLYNFKDMQDAKEFKGSFLTGDDTVFINPVVVAAIVFAFCTALFAYTNAITYDKNSGLGVIFDPYKDGVENLARFIGEINKGKMLAN